MISDCSRQHQSLWSWSLPRDSRECLLSISATSVKELMLISSTLHFTRDSWRVPVPSEGRPMSLDAIPPRVPRPSAMSPLSLSLSREICIANATCVAAAAAVGVAGDASKGQTGCDKDSCQRLRDFGVEIPANFRLACCRGILIY